MMHGEPDGGFVVRGSLPPLDALGGSDLSCVEPALARGEGTAELAKRSGPLFAQTFLNAARLLLSLSLELSENHARA